MIMKKVLLMMVAALFAVSAYAEKYHVNGELTKIKIVTQDMKNVDAFVVDADNPYHSVVNGVLMNKEKTTLWRYPSGRKKVSKYRIPASVEVVFEFAFMNAKIDTLVITSGLKNISERAFLFADIKHFVVERNPTFYVKDDALYKHGRNNKGEPKDFYFGCRGQRPQIVLAKDVTRDIISYYLNSDGRSYSYIYRDNKPSVVIFVSHWNLEFAYMMGAFCRKYKNLNTYMSVVDQEDDEEMVELSSCFGLHAVPVVLVMNGPVDGEPTYFYRHFGGGEKDIETIKDRIEFMLYKARKL